MTITGIIVAVIAGIFLVSIANVLWLVTSRQIDEARHVIRTRRHVRKPEVERKFQFILFGVLVVTLVSGMIVVVLALLPNMSNSAGNIWQILLPIFTAGVGAIVGLIGGRAGANK